MAPPKTYRNITTKMTGWIVANTSSCGLRLMLSRLRHAIVMASPTA